MDDSKKFKITLTVSVIKPNLEYTFEEWNTDDYIKDLIESGQELKVEEISCRRSFE